MADRDPVNLGASALRAMFDEGRADEVARMMLAAGKVFPGFIDLLQDGKWPVRLAAMVAFETLAEQNPDYARKVVQRLQQNFDDLDETIQGDILYVLGESALSSVRPWIDGVATGDLRRGCKRGCRRGP